MRDLGFPRYGARGGVQHVSLGSRLPESYAAPVGRYSTPRPSPLATPMRAPNEAFRSVAPARR